MSTICVIFLIALSSYLSIAVSSFTTNSAAHPTSQSERPILRVRRQRLQLRQELQQVLRRLGQDPGQHGAAGAGADAAHSMVSAVPAGRPADRTDHLRQDDGAEVRHSGHQTWRPDAQAENEDGDPTSEVSGGGEGARGLRVWETLDGLTILSCWGTLTAIHFAGIVCCFLVKSDAV